MMEESPGQQQDQIQYGKIEDIIADKNESSLILHCLIISKTMEDSDTQPDNWDTHRQNKSHSAVIVGNMTKIPLLQVMNLIVYPRKYGEY